jgi:hypothetical protein
VLGPVYEKPVSRPQFCRHAPRTPVGKCWATPRGESGGGPIAAALLRVGDFLPKWIGDEMTQNQRADLIRRFFQKPMRVTVQDFELIGGIDISPPSSRFVFIGVALVVRVADDWLSRRNLTSINAIRVFVALNGVVPA